MDVSAKVFLKDTFRKYDRDRSGAIDQAELRAIFEDLNIHFTDEVRGVDGVDRFTLALVSGLTRARRRRFLGF